MLQQELEELEELEEETLLVMCAPQGLAEPDREGAAMCSLRLVRCDQYQPPEVERAVQVTTVLQKVLV